MSKTAAETNAVPTENLPRTSCYDENKDAHMRELSLARLRRHVYRSARNESSKETVASPLEAKVLPHAPVSTTTMDDLPSPDRNSMDQISDKGNMDDFPSPNSMDQSLANTIRDKDIANMECACQPGLRTLMAEYSREEKDVANFLLEMASRTRPTESKVAQVCVGYFSTEVCEHDK
ncbi:uncharacterized protein [Dermacentor albipictus]|uniref:uncharacterized protein isoform X1 n=1 Tax=Dermacentor albipictus TaxID=60249 RepID=UPI0038FC4FBC